MRHSMSKDTAFNAETTPRHTFLCSDSQCLPPGDPRILCAKHGYPITGKSFIGGEVLEPSLICGQLHVLCPTPLPRLVSSKLLGTSLPLFIYLVFIFLANYFDLFLIHYFMNKNSGIMFLGVPGVRLICGTVDRGTVEPVEPAEPKEMTVLLQLPLVNVIK